MIVPTKLLHHLAKVPTRATPTDAGRDLYSIETHEILAGRRALVKTGVSLAIPVGWYGRIAGRSGLAVKSGIQVLGGVCDAGYRGDVGVCLHNTSHDTFYVQPGDRIAQIIFEQCADAELVLTEGELPASVRGAGGFGSTGV